MIRGISTKWMLGVLLSLALPLMGFAWYARDQVTAPRADEVVRFHLLGTAADLSNRLYAELVQGQEDAKVLASVPVIGWFAANSNGKDRGTFLQHVEGVLNGMVKTSGIYSRIFVLGTDGSVIAWNTSTKEGRRLTQDQVEEAESF
ncbi:MAG: hypothetical protein GY930_08790, partial [bacterium]|nr:hypothetical protein [bacterium]